MAGSLGFFFEQSASKNTSLIYGRAFSKIPFYVEINLNSKDLGFFLHFLACHGKYYSHTMVSWFRNFCLLDRNVPQQSVAFPASEKERVACGLRGIAPLDYRHGLSSPLSLPVEKENGASLVPH